MHVHVCVDGHVCVDMCVCVCVCCACVYVCVSVCVFLIKPSFKFTRLGARTSNTSVAFANHWLEPHESRHMLPNHQFFPFFFLPFFLFFLSTALLQLNGTTPPHEGYEECLARITRPADSILPRARSRGHFAALLRRRVGIYPNFVTEVL